jgi:hypothetical protein
LKVSPFTVESSGPWVRAFSRQRRGVRRSSGALAMRGSRKAAEGSRTGKPGGGSATFFALHTSRFTPR